VLRQQGQVDEALASFREAIRCRPGMAEGHRSLGQILQQRRDAAGAAAAFAEADRLTQQKADAQAAVLAVGVGKQRSKDGDLPGAIERFRAALVLDPRNAEAHFRLAEALRRRGALSESRDHLAEARRLAPFRFGPETP
jgi:Flp pilus assembly protein TadD